MDDNRPDVHEGGELDDVMEAVRKNATAPPDSLRRTGGQRSTAEVLLAELVDILAPLADAADVGPEGVAAVLEDSGISRELFSEPDFETVTETFTASVDTIESTRSVLEGETPTSTEIADLVVDVVELIKAIKGLDEVRVKDPNIEAVGEKLLDYLIIEYFRWEHTTVYAFLVLGGVIVQKEDEPDELALEKLPELLQDAGNIPTTVLKWGTQEFDPALLLYLLKISFQQLGIPTSSPQVTQSELSTLAQVQTDASKAPTKLEIPVISGAVGSAGLRLVPLPSDGSKNPGLALMPFGAGKLDLETTLDLEGNWKFKGEFTGNASASGWGLAARPTDSGLSAQFRDLKEGSNLEFNASTEAELSYDGTTDEGENTVLLGKPDGTRVGLGSVSARANLSYDGDDIGYELGLPSSGTLAIAPGDADGFLQKVLPPDGIAYNFDAEVGYGSGRGLFFERGGTLEASIPQEASLGPVTLKEIYLAALPPSASSSGNSSGKQTSSSTDTATTTDGTITIAAAASASVSLGPATATVRRMGVEADVSFPEDRDGNYGPVDMRLGFKPPSGAGIKLEAGPVTAGGYLEWDPDNERYAGIVQIKLKKLTINAIGLLTTELPNGDDGFSLLVIINGDLPQPVQIGMGFTLEAVGGLIGANRQLKQKPLGKAVRNGSMGSILFPQNPIENSQRIISDLRSIFPPRDDSHVVGPMAQIGYTGGSFLFIDVGVVLAIPTWEVVLLGKVSAFLPGEGSDMVEINVGVVGVLDIPNKRAKIDGSLYDSRIYKITLTGDMAMRTRWGDDPRFAFAVGGWHPRFEPPGNFPKLDPLKATLGKDDGQFRVELRGYLAMTSNTFQFGANVLATGEIGPILFAGKITFDTLLEFDPFTVVSEFRSKFTVSYEGNKLIVEIDGRFTGPGPFRLTATLNIDLMGLTLNEQVNTTFGPSERREELPRAKILPKLTEQLGKPVNWRGQLPAEGAELVTFRDIEAGEDEVLAHPLGEIGVRQSVVPLELGIEKFGNATPTGYTTFTIDGVSTDGSNSISFDSKLQEEFAPAKYQQMSDAEKLDSEAFLNYPAGRAMTHSGIYCGYDSTSQATNVREASLTYECTVVDKPRDNWSASLGELGQFGTDNLDATSTLPAIVGESLLQVSASAQSEARSSGNDRFRLSAGERSMVADQAAGLGHEIDTVSSTAGGADSQQVIRGGSDPDVGGLSEPVSMSSSSYTVATAGDMRAVDGVDGAMTKARAQQTLRAIRQENPEVAKQLRVVETRKVQSNRSAVTDGGRNT